MAKFNFICNNHYSSIDILKEEERKIDFQKYLKKIYDKKNILKEDELFNSDVFVLSKSEKDASISTDRFVYKIVLNAEKLFVPVTGLYVGTIFVNGIEINIDCEYDEIFLSRMLDTETNVFVQREVIPVESIKNNNKRSLCSYIIEYLFLSSLKKQMFIGLPQEYKSIDKISYNVEGRIDIKNYLSHKHSLKGRIPFTKRERAYNQDIIDVLASALNSMNNFKYFEDMKQYKTIITNLSPKKNLNNISRIKIINAKKAKCLNNAIYQPYKKVLEYAEMVLFKQNLIKLEGASNKELTGFLVNIADLWEDYVASILKNYFDDWKIITQEEIVLYNDAFFKRKNRPDIVMIKYNDNGDVDSVVILDAKFKKMNFLPGDYDVDRADMFQIHSYVGYYKSLYGDKVKLCGLVYPTINVNNSGKQTYSQLYGIETNNTKFAVLTIFASLNAKEQSFEYNELKFVESIRQHL